MQPLLPAITEKGFPLEVKKRSNEHSRLLKRQKIIQYGETALPKWEQTDADETITLPAILKSRGFPDLSVYDSTPEGTPNNLLHQGTYLGTGVLPIKTKILPDDTEETTVNVCWFLDPFCPGGRALQLRCAPVG